MHKLRKQRVETVFGTDIILAMCSPGGLWAVAKSNQLPDAVEKYGVVRIYIYTVYTHILYYIIIVGIYVLFFYSMRHQVI